MRHNSVITSGLLLLAVAGFASADVELHGVLKTVSHTVQVDSAILMLPGGVLDTVLTPGWGGDSMTVDTFDFPEIVSWPMRVTLYSLVDLLPHTQVVLNPVPGAWQLFQGVPPPPPMVMFYGGVGVEESRSAIERRPCLTVSPSIVGASATIRAERVAGTNCVFEFFDAAGNRVRTLGTHASSSGAASATWDGTDDLGRSLPEGIYYCCLGGAANPLVRKLVLTR